MIVKDQGKAYIYGITAVVIWSTVATAFKLTLRYMEPFHLLLWSSMISTLVLAVIVLLSGKAGQVFSSRPREYATSALLGALNPFVYYLVLFWSYDILRAQEAQALNYTWPIILVVLSIILLKQRIGLLSISGILLSFIGIVLISTKGSLVGFVGIDPFGVFLALYSAAVWALYWTFNLRYKRNLSVKLFMNFLFGTAFIALFLLVTEGISFPGIRGFAGAFYIGVLEMGVTFVIWLRALSLSKDTSRISNLIYLSPFVSLVLIGTVLGEAILPTTILGLLLIVAGIILGRSRGMIFRAEDSKSNR